MGNSSGKIRSRDSALIWRAAERGKVAFTNGVFDLLHPGHIQVIEAARAEADCLIVGVNSDQSVRQLGKGADRPIVDQASRARVLAALAAVDCVVVFDEPTPQELIAELCPDVLVKGGDYDAESIVGSGLIRANGGRVVIVPLVEDQSTTRILERLRATP